MTWVAGVDGCRAGWMVVMAKDSGEGTASLRIQLCSGFDQVLALSPAPDVIALDIPIGLLDQRRPGGRICDQEARRLLGRRASSVFTPPTRALLQAYKFSDVRGKGLSIQSFGILPKIREVDRFMTPELQKRVYEAHPELAFRAFAGHPMRFNKKTSLGRKERLRALQMAPMIRSSDIANYVRRSAISFSRNQVAPDDLLDAAALVNTGLRITEHCAVRIPTHPALDPTGLRMEIWY